jgi:hypothetical protein
MSANSGTTGYLYSYTCVDTEESIKLLCLGPIILRLFKSPLEEILEGREPDVPVPEHIHWLHGLRSA